MKVEYNRKYNAVMVIKYLQQAIKTVVDLFKLKK